MARPFAIAVIGLYLASFASQVLLSSPVTQRLDVFPFAIVQALLIWLWIALHTRRLRDAGRSSGLAVGIAMVYALEIVLLIILVWLILASAGPQLDGAEMRVLDFMVFLYLLTLLSGDPNLGGLHGSGLFIPVVLMLLPAFRLSRLGFSLLDQALRGRAAVRRQPSRRHDRRTFAYGSNMSRAVMRKHAPNARALGVAAALRGFRFVITGDGYASVKSPRRCRSGPRRALAADAARPRDARRLGERRGRALSRQDFAGAPPPGRR